MDVFIPKINIFQLNLSTEITPDVKENSSILFILFSQVSWGFLVDIVKSLKILRKENSNEIISNNQNHPETNKDTQKNIFSIHYTVVSVSKYTKTLGKQKACQRKNIPVNLFKGNISLFFSLIFHNLNTLFSFLQN